MVTTMTKMQTTPFDAAQYLDGPDVLAEYLTEALETRDAALIVKAVETAVRALRRGLDVHVSPREVSQEDVDLFP